MQDLLFQPDGALVIVLPVTDGNGSVTGKELARINPDGSLDTTFDNNAIVALNGFGPTAFAVQADGKILVTGGSYEASYSDYVALERLNVDGKVRHRKPQAAPLDPMPALALTIT